MTIQFNDETFRDDYTFQQLRLGDPTISVSVPRRQLHVFSEHGAASRRARGVDLRETL